MANARSVHPEEVAQGILDKHGMGSFPINPVSVAELEGAKVFDASFRNPEVTGLIQKNGSTPVIYVKNTDNLNRKRFTVAHELGHLCLHLKDENGNFIDNEVSLYRMSPLEDDITGDPLAFDENRIREIQANQFAAALLMPKDVVKNQWQSWKSVEFLSDLFGVSIPAMTIRLRNLGLIDG